MFLKFEALDSPANEWLRYLFFKQTYAWQMDKDLLWQSATIYSSTPLKSLLTGNNDWEFVVAQQASAALYHLHTLSVMTAVGRNRQVWVTPSPVTAETRGTDETHCDRSLTSNCCNHLTPPRPTPHVCTKWGGVVLQSSNPLSWRVNINGYSKRDPWEASLWNSLTAHSPITFFSSLYFSRWNFTLIMSVLLCGQEKLFKTAHNWLCSHFFWKNASIISHTTFNPLLLFGGAFFKSLRGSNGYKSWGRRKGIFCNNKARFYATHVSGKWGDGPGNRRIPIYLASSKWAPQPPDPLWHKRKPIRASGSTSASQPPQWASAQPVRGSEVRGGGEKLKVGLLLSSSLIGSTGFMALNYMWFVSAGRKPRRRVRERSRAVRV